MNHPAMQGLALNVPAFVKNAKLIAWVADMAALCKPDSIYWCDGSDAQYQQQCQQLVDAGTFKKLNPVTRPNSFLALNPKRRGRPDQQLDGTGRDARHAATLV
jgi:phosphoenolpyruvate carboxykinase (GTP)